jgi:hypothetical protein
MAMRITAAVALMAICIQGSTSVAQTPTPTFKRGVELVRTDAIVRDARGQFIADLKAGEFEVYEDGVKQEIVAPTMIHGGREFNADLVLELAELTRAANRANATIYAIDPRGLAAGPDIDADVRVPEWNAYVRRSQDSLRVMAEETGGFAMVNMNDFSAGLNRRRDQRLLCTGLLVEQHRPAQARQADRRQDDASGCDGCAPDVLYASACSMKSVTRGQVSASVAYNDAT